MSHTTADVQTLAPEELRTLGKGLKSTVLSWYALAVLLWRVENEALFEAWGYASARAYAQDELGIPPRDFVTLLELAKMVMNAGPAVTQAEWCKLTKAKALLVKKVAALGGDMKSWVNKAALAQNATEFTKTVAAAIGGKPDEWTMFKCAVPAELLELIEVALVMALQKALPEEPAPAKERARDKDVRFRCLETIVTEWVQANATVDAL